MTKPLKTFLVTATIILVAIIFASEAIFFTIFETFCFPFRITSIIFVWLVTCSSHFWLMKTVTDNPKAFDRVFMMQTMLKLLMYVACITVYLIVFRQHGVSFTLHFLIVYLFFAIFEVSSILKFVKENSGRNAGEES